MTTYKQRDLTFDIMKGFLIFLVVLGHAIQLLYISTGLDVWYQPVFNIIYTFHMPLFIFVSGVFFKSALNKRFKELLTNKFKRLLLPAIVYSTIIVLAYMLINGNCSPTGAFLYKQYKTYWYLICLFCLTTMYWCFFKGKWAAKTAFITVYAGGVILYDNLPAILIKDCQIIRQTLIFGFGAYLSLIGLDNLIKRKIAVLISCISVIIAVRFLYGVNMMDFPIYIRIIDQFACSMLVFCSIFHLFYTFRNHKLTKPLIYLGQNSLGIYLIHIVLFRLCQFTEFQVLFNAFNVIIITVIWLITSVFIIELLKRLFKSYSFVLGV